MARWGSGPARRPTALQEGEEDDHSDGHEDDEDSEGSEHLLEGEAPFIAREVFDL